MKKNWLYLVGCVVIGLYLAGVRFLELDKISTIFVTIATIIGGIAIFIQLKRERDLMEAQFLMEYNNTFITNEAFTKVQKLLEDYYKGKIDDKQIKEFDRQSIINYLVYLEALAALINKGVLSFTIIDNLFSYRFFIALNNPVIQELELIVDAEFYRGCYVLHKNWTKYKQKKGLEVVLKDSSLSKVEGYKIFSKS